MEMHYCILPIEVARSIGSRNYYTLKKCPRGHSGARVVKKRACATCVSIDNAKRSKNRYISKREEICQEKRQRYHEDPEYRDKVKSQNKIWYQNNSDYAIRKQSERYWSDPESHREWHRSYYRCNKERKIMYQIDYKDKNPERVKAWQSSNRDGRISRTFDLDKDLTQFVLEQAYGLSREREELFGFKWHVDHAIPLMGKLVSGFHFWNNIQVIPAHVNWVKYNRMIYTEPLEWLADYSK